MRQIWTEADLEQHWVLTDAERAHIAPVNKDLRLGFAIQLKHLELVGRFPRHRGEVPTAVTEFLANQLGVDLEEGLSRYPWISGRTLKRHRSIAREHLGFRPASRRDSPTLKKYLLAKVTPYEPRPSSVLDEALLWFRTERIEPPSAVHVDRVVASALRDEEEQVFDRIATAIDEPTRQRLDALLESDDEGGSTAFATLRAEPGRPGVDTIHQHADRLQTLRELGLPDGVLSALPSAVVKTYRARAGTEPASGLRERTDRTRWALLAAYLWCRRREVIDTLNRKPQPGVVFGDWVSLGFRPTRLCAIGCRKR